MPESVGSSQLQPSQPGKPEESEQITTAKINSWFHVDFVAYPPHTSCSYNNVHPNPVTMYTPTLLHTHQKPATPNSPGLQDLKMASDAVSYASALPNSWHTHTDVVYVNQITEHQPTPHSDRKSNYTLKNDLGFPSTHGMQKKKASAVSSKPLRSLKNPAL